MTTLVADRWETEMFIFMQQSEKEIDLPVNMDVISDK